MISRSLPFRSSLLALALFGATAPAWSQTTPASPAPYSLVDISQFLFSNSVGGGTNTTVVDDINDQGQLIASFGGQGFLVRGGERIEIAAPNSGWVFPRGLSPSGKVTGDFVAGDDRYHAFLFGGGQFTDVDTTDHYRSIGYAVNDAGQIAGTYQTGFSNRAVRFSDGNVSDIPFPDPMPAEMQYPGYIPQEPVYSEATDINSDGSVTGFLYFESFGQKGYYFDGTVTHYLASEFGNDAAFAINDAGDIVGFSFDGEGSYAATLWTNGGQTQTFLPPLDDNFSATFANDINNQGQIVGYARTVEEVRRATLWQNGQIVDLNTLIPAGSGWVLETATRINNRGEILGWGRINGGEEQQYVLTLRANDTLAPVTTAEIQPSFGNGEWIAASGQLALLAVDRSGSQAVAGSGVASTYYRIANGPVRSYTDRISFPNSGFYKVNYWSVDRAGNTETTKSTTVKVDNQPPTVAAARLLQLPVPGDKELVLVHGKVSDLFSGLDKSSVSYEVFDEFGVPVSNASVQVRSNGSFDFSVTLPSKVARSDKDGRPFQIVVSAIDFAGNIGSKTVSVVTGKKGSSHSS